MVGEELEHHFTCKLLVVVLYGEAEQAINKTHGSYLIR